MKKTLASFVFFLAGLLAPALAHAIPPTVTFDRDPNLPWYFLPSPVIRVTFSGPAGMPVPTGFPLFNVGFGTFCQPELDAQGKAACAIFIVPGVYAGAIVYYGDGVYDPITVPFTFTQRNTYESAVNLVSSANPVVPGTAVTFTASPYQVYDPLPLDGTVTFRNGGVDIPGCSPVGTTNAAAHCTVTLPAGTHSITATFGGIAGIVEPSTSAPLVQVVQAPVTPAVPRPDFDLSGKADLLFRNNDGRSAIWLMNGLTTTASAEIFPAGTAWQVSQMADLNGDGKTDLVWQHPDGRITVYLMNGTTATTRQLILPAGGGWTVTHTADLNGDGKADLIFRNADGTTAAWVMNGTAMTAGATLLGAGSGWSVVSTGDFDGDGKADLLWRHTDGRHAIWLMDGIIAKSTTQILNAGAWTAIHAADLNGDGKADIVWRHTDGTIAAWLMNGASMTSGATLLNAGSGWNVTRTGDFNGDGKADLFFQHSDGRAAIYLMNGLMPTTTTQILNAGGGWSAKRIQDLNGDGKADIVWENVDGRVAVWLMNGTAMTSGSGIMAAGTGWVVSGVSP